MNFEPFIYEKIRFFLPKFTKNARLLAKTITRLKKLRLEKLFTKILGPLWKQNHYRIEIDITYECNLKCYNCDRSCRLAPSEERMSVEQIRKFVRESIEQDRKWDIIRVLGGEPTLHPQLQEILEIILDYKNKFSPATIVQLVTNGFGKEVNGVLAKVPQGIEIANSRKTSPEIFFYAAHTAPVDLEEYKNADYSNACWNVKQCGLGLNKYGYYPCAAGAAIDRVFGFDIGKKRLPPEKDSMLGQMKLLCEYCGYFRWDKIVVNAEEMTITWKNAYEKIKSIKPKLTPY